MNKKYAISIIHELAAVLNCQRKKLGKMLLELLKFIFIKPQIYRPLNILEFFELRTTNERNWRWERFENKIRIPNRRAGLNEIPIMRSGLEWLGSMKPTKYKVNIFHSQKLNLSPLFLLPNLTKCTELNAKYEMNNNF